MPDARAFDDGIDLHAALQALPLETPDRSAWPALAARLPANAPRRRPWKPLAAAAALLAVALLVPRAPSPDTLAGASVTAAAPATGTVAGHDASLAALMAESARLERLVDAASNDVAGNGSALSLSLALEDQLHAIDAALDQAGGDDARRRALWSERVTVLRAAAGFETSRRYDAAQGRGFELGLVAAL